MKPIVDGLEAQFGDQLAFQRINANEGDGPAIMRAYRVQGHPTILIVDAQGQEVNRLIGPQSAEQLTEVLQQVLAAATGQRVSATASATLPPLPTLDAAEIVLGRQIYLGQCAACHGQNAEGQPNWKAPDAKGNLPARHTMTVVTPGIMLTDCCTKLFRTASVTHSSQPIVP